MVLVVKRKEKKKNVLTPSKSLTFLDPVYSNN